MRILLFEVNWLKNFEKLVSDFFGVIPNIVGALLVFIIGYLIAKLVANIVKRVLKKSGVDTLGDKLNAIDLVQDNNVNIVPSTLFSKVFYYILLLFVIVLATDILQIEAVSELMTKLVTYTPNIIVAIIVLGIALLIGDTIKGLVQSACESFNIPSAKMIGNLVFFLILIMGIMSALMQLGVETDFMGTVFSILIGGIVLAFALGYGLASKDAMSNFLASKQNEDKFSIGDIISIDGTKGTIVNIDNSSITVQSENSKIIIPLHKFASEKIEVFNS